MDERSIAAARADIESTGDLLERALKLSGLVASLFQDQRLRAAFDGQRAPTFG